MIWGDLLLDCARSKEALRVALARAFGIEFGQVAIVDDVSEIPGPGVATVVCQQSLHGGQFPWRLSVYVFGGNMSPFKVDIAKKLATQLAVRCLVSDGQRDPYTMTLVTVDGTESVNIDASRLDSIDEYWIQ